MRTRPLVDPPFSVARLWVAFFLLTVLFSASTAHATTATMVSPAAGGTVSGAISISASISPNSGYASVVFWADNWTQIGSSSSSQLTYNSAALSNGSHNFFVTVLDSAGNTLCASNIVSATVQRTTRRQPWPRPRTAQAFQEPSIFPLRLTRLTVMPQSPSGWITGRA